MKFRLRGERMSVNKVKTKVKDKQTGKKVDKVTYEVNLRIKDTFGNTVRIHKRGFHSEKDAEAYEKSVLNEYSVSPIMTFKDFYTSNYLPRMEKKLRATTLETKKHIFDTKILPVLGKLQLCQITKAKITNWQDQMEDKNLSPGYLKTINNQLNAFLNYAEKRVEGFVSPHRSVDGMGKKSKSKDAIWTIAEFDKFLEVISDKYESYVIFQLLFYTGMRISELLALEISDVDFDAKSLSISKGLHRIKGEDIIADPKNESSKRCVYLPNFLVEILREYIRKLPYDDGRLFQKSKGFIEREMKRGIELSGNSRITVHGLRHSSISYLIYKKVPLVEIQKQVGHSLFSSETLETYAHVYAEAERRIANIFDDEVSRRGSQ